VGDCANAGRKHANTRHRILGQFFIRGTSVTDGAQKKKAIPVAESL
jgi:hypothetical protein